MTIPARQARWVHAWCIPAVAAASVLGGATMPQAIAATTYTNILATNQAVTGVRGATGGNVSLTGAGPANGVMAGFIYLGPLAPTDSAGLYFPAPAFAGETVTGSVFYGPDTWVYNASYGTGNVRVVGSYTYSESDVHDHGLIYQGPPAGGGIWTQIDVPPSLTGGAVVEDTIPHSTMGDLVVGNYDLQGHAAVTYAFIYNVVAKTWVTLDLGGGTDETTAYGIWQNGIGSASYTICGGTVHKGVMYGFLVDYDEQTGALTHRKLYTYANTGVELTHFEGIMASEKGYTIAGLGIGVSAGLAAVTRGGSGAFSAAKWIEETYPGSASTSGNSVYGTTLLGVYTLPGSQDLYSYIGTQ